MSRNCRRARTIWSRRHQQRTSSCDRRCRVVIVLAEPPASASTSSTAIWLMYPFQMATACDTMSNANRRSGQLSKAEAPPCGTEHGVFSAACSHAAPDPD